MATILVTGGLGSVGSPLVDKLEARGHDVWVADLPWSEREKYYRCDVGEYRQLARIFEDREFDFVYHLAAEFGRMNGENFYETMWRSNATGTKHMLRLQQEHGFKMIFSSSSEVYGDYDGVMEESVPHEKSIRQLNDYAISKWVNEQQVMNSADRHGTETVRVRLFNTYGPGEKYSEYRSVVAKFCYRALHDEPYHVYEDHHRSFTYVGDTVNTLANIVDNFIAGEVYNIANTEYHGIKELSDLILDYLDKDDSKVEYRGTEEHNTLNKRASVERAERDLDHDPQMSLEEGIPKTIEWMRDYYDVE
ncbi:NAD(P)-dependent oxidoreductase [Halorubrum ezzemoulense]|uniref:NAD-dependent epimerase/dehydratase family protein n=1 Tax=Halorubrum ezzemoulense TaxID=337243 RepID=UPI00232ED303|nr:NAD(P)-dependent oxidoreductase [Halorubrum ezzemoulense]MDB9249152.1 NAD(P)-dependent oxidoreductase [Halorubrum ezzemoulense]MDB9259692.1 NAD(P)-dependent oxidoreductase [Halorubrum ezzemoulense]MDB9263157.1 NAD(P)-dependent oxidoreductase [Halorubrum ezzemoulense]MDB9266413.1 NAD(P)-dependent oxidoreductase [Halorubrum ezzemoulense]MDB9270053.1 NAD(P)-dependent oxidoreductase [Halorubrum ezzemoulense]